MNNRALSSKPVTTEKICTTAHTVNLKQVLHSQQSELFSVSFSISVTCNDYQRIVTLEFWKEVRNRDQFRYLAQLQI